MSVTPGQVVRQVKDSFGKSADQNGSFLVANKDHLRGPQVSKGNLYFGIGARGSLLFVRASFRAFLSLLVIPLR